MADAAALLEELDDAEAAVGAEGGWAADPPAAADAAAAALVPSFCRSMAEAMQAALAADTVRTGMSTKRRAAAR